MNTELLTGELKLRVCNLTYLKNFAGGDQDFIRQMIELFFIQVPEELNNIRNHVSLNNFTDVKNVAHKLKSSVSLLGAESMAIHLKQIEDLALSGTDSSGILNHYDQLIQINEEAVLELKAYIASL